MFLPHQPPLDKFGHRLSARLTDKLKVVGIHRPLRQHGRQALLQFIELVILIESRPPALRLLLHERGVNRRWQAGANRWRQHHADVIASGESPSVRETEMITECYRHTNLDNGRAQIEVIPANPFLIAALEGFVALGNGQFQNVALS